MLLKDLIKIPEGKPQFLHKDKIEWSLGWCEGRNKLREEIGNISVCLDVGKMELMVMGIISEWLKEHHAGGIVASCPKVIAQHFADCIGEIILETK